MVNFLILFFSQNAPSWTPTLILTLVKMRTQVVVIGEYTMHDFEQHTKITISAFYVIHASPSPSFALKKVSIALTKYNSYYILLALSIISQVSDLSLAHEDTLV